MKRELIFLRTFAVTTAIGMLLVATSAFQKNGNQKFSEIDVERINIVEKVMIIWVKNIYFQNPR